MHTNGACSQNPNIQPCLAAQELHDFPFDIQQLRAQMRFRSTVDICRVSLVDGITFHPSYTSVEWDTLEPSLAALTNLQLQR